VAAGNIYSHPIDQTLGVGKKMVLECSVGLDGLCSPGHMAQWDFGLWPCQPGFVYLAGRRKTPMNISVAVRVAGDTRGA
jgi:hypothetical protein